MVRVFTVFVHLIVPYCFIVVLISMFQLFCLNKNLKTIYFYYLKPYLMFHNIKFWLIYKILRQILISFKTVTYFYLLTPLCCTR